MKKATIGLINLGCPKNLVDAELMLGKLLEKGYKTTLDENEADIVIVNTCGFISDAEKESVKEMVRIAQSGKKLVVTGCLVQKHKKELKEALPEALALVSPSNMNKIAEIIENLGKFQYEVDETPEYKHLEGVERAQITVGASSYIKIADGCNYSCGFCIIPQLRGKYVSRSIENIVKEAKTLARKGVSEIVLVAQDTTAYGRDLYGKSELAKLLGKLNNIDNLEWIRVMYAYPSTLGDDFIDAVSKLDKVVKYIDMPLQHSHPEILESMNRPVSDYSDLIKKLRDKIENLAIRTAFIVGYPGETEEHFEHLYNFVEENRFDRVGVFKYSREKGTKSYNLKPQIPAKTKNQRYKEIMLLQQGISKEINNSLIGKKLPTIIETIDTKGNITGRTYRDAPEIDGIISIKTDKHLLPGDIITTTVTGADEYDLFGEF